MRKDSFKWNAVAQTAFQQLKKAMKEIPILALPDFAKQFVIETDAFGYGLGVVLMQDNRPLAFFSKKLSPSV